MMSEEVNADLKFASIYPEEKLLRHGKRPVSILPAMLSCYLLYLPLPSCHILFFPPALVSLLQIHILLFLIVTSFFLCYICRRFCNYSFFPRFSCPYCSCIICHINLFLFVLLKILPHPSPLLSCTCIIVVTSPSSFCPFHCHIPLFLLVLAQLSSHPLSLPFCILYNCYSYPHLPSCNSNICVTPPLVYFFHFLLFLIPLV